jgi:hypothetical protein
MHGLRARDGASRAPVAENELAPMIKTAEADDGCGSITLLGGTRNPERWRRFDIDTVVLPGGSN